MGGVVGHLERLRAQYAPLGQQILRDIERMRISYAESSLVQQVQELADAQELIRTLHIESPLQQEMRKWVEAKDRFIESFVTPLQSQIQDLARLSVVDTDSLAKQVFGQDLQTMVSRMAGMSEPWLHRDYASISARAFGNLQAIGGLVGTPTGYSEYVASALRSTLGDWRDPLVVEFDFAQVEVRNAIYVERGLDLTLTDFPEPAFDEGVEQAGLIEVFSDLEAESAEGSASEGVGLARAQQCFPRLQYLEARLRRFIEAVMLASFGDQWIKQRVPPSIRDSWVTKREKAIKDGRPDAPLIDFADFTDYLPIIERKDNWNDVFKVVFDRSESIRESLQRLYPVRIAVMHARILTLDDELYFLAEATRILRRIDNKP